MYIKKKITNIKFRCKIDKHEISVMLHKHA